MARRLYVTRQAVSRWETGETTPGIDMVKLICVSFGVPLERFFDMPMSYYCQCCSMPIPDEELHGTEAVNAANEKYVAMGEAAHLQADELARLLREGGAGSGTVPARRDPRVRVMHVGRQDWTEFDPAIACRSKDERSRN